MSDTKDGVVRLWNSIMVDEESRKREDCLESIVKSLEVVKQKLEQLQINTGGEKEEPREHPHGKIECRVRCTIISLGLIDTIKQEFWAEIYLSVTWIDNDLKGQNVGDVDWSKYWDPQLYFVNAVHVDHKEQWHTITEKTADSTIVKLSIRMRANFKSIMKLHSFPFDYQELTIKLMSDWKVGKLRFVRDRDTQDYIRSDTFTDSEWTLRKHVLAKPLEEKREQTGARSEFPHYHISFHVERYYAPYLLNIILVMFVISCLGFTSFAIPIEQVEARFGVNVALLLTAVAYKFVVNAKLPTVPYLTLMDKYVLWILILHALMVIQNAVCLPLASFVTRSTTIVDHVCAAVLGGLVLLVNGVFLVIALKKTRRTDKHLTELENKYETRRPRENSNKVSRKQQTEPSHSYNRLLHSAAERDVEEGKACSVS